MNFLVVMFMFAVAISTALVGLYIVSIVAAGVGIHMLMNCLLCKKEVGDVEKALRKKRVGRR